MAANHSLGNRQHWGVQSAVRRVTRVESFDVVSNSISPTITNMGRSLGQRRVCLLCYQNHSDWSTADACEEYKNSLDLMTVAKFQKCVPFCVYELQKLSDWAREVSPAPPSQFVSQVRAFTDQTVWSGPVGSAVCSWAALAYWPRQLCHQHQQMPQNFHLLHFRVWEKASAQEIGRCQHWFMSRKNYCVPVPDELVSLWDNSVCLLTATHAEHANASK